MRRLLLTGIQSHQARARKWGMPVAELPGILASDAWRAAPVVTLDQVLRETKEINNTGNFLIGEGAVAALRDHAELVYAPFWRMQQALSKPEERAQIRTRFDAVVLVTANLLRSDYSAAAEADFVKALNLPLVVLGMGLQRRRDLDVVIPPGTATFIEALRERGDHVLTRGTETAEFLQKHGVAHVTPTGCPSLYFRPEAMVEAIEALPRLDLASHPRVIASGYLGHSKAAIRDIALAARFAGRVDYALQDEFHHYAMKLSAPPGQRVYDPATGRLECEIGYEGAETESVGASLHIFFDNDAWRGWAGAHDVHVGRRFHGGVVAMQAGRPSIFIAIDDRMREMLALSGIPHLETQPFDAAKDQVALLKEFCQGVDVAKSVASYRAREAGFREALRKAGLTS
jgi:hypothetical protein